MVAEPQLNFVNQETTAQTGLFRCYVPWGTGEISDISVLKTNRVVEWDGGQIINTCFWTEFGPRHRDGSVRNSVVEFEATIPAGMSNPQAPTVIATVRSGANTEPTPVFPDTEIADMEIDLSYTDWENNQAYGPTSILAMARAGTNNATWTETVIGGRKIIRAEAYFGRGTHYEQERVGGFNTQTAPVSTTGNVHARIWLEFYHNQTFGHGTLGLFNDAAYPSPAEPPDGGLRQPGNASRPCRLEPGAGEELDDPIGQHFQDMRVHFYSPSQCPMSTRIWYVRNPNQGDSINGHMPRLNSRDEFPIQIGGLGAFQGWAVKFCTSFRATQAFDQAYVNAIRPLTFLGLPTHDTWMGTDRTGTLPGAYSSNPTMRITTGFRLPLLPADTSLQQTWFRQGKGRYDQFRDQQLFGNTGASTPHANHYNDPWQLLGHKVSPTGGGAARQLGHLQEGRIIHGGSIYDLQILMGQSMRLPARAGHLWGLETIPYFYGSTDERITVWFSGSELRGVSRNSVGRWSADSGSNGQTAHYQGQAESLSNPDFLGGIPSNGGKWGYLDHAHMGLRPEYITALLTQDPFTTDMVRAYAIMNSYRFCHRTYFGRNPADSTQRGETRQLNTQMEAWWLTGEEVFRTNYLRRVNQWFTVPTGGTHRWTPWPIGASPDGGAVGGPCDVPPSQRFNFSPIYSPWQAAHSVVFLLNAALEWADFDATTTELMVDVVKMYIQSSAERCFALDETRISATAQRTVDACFQNVISWRPAAEVAALLQFGYGCGRFYEVQGLDNDPFDLGTEITNVSLLIRPSNGGENQDNYPAMQAYRLFPELNSIPGFQERIDFIISALFDQFSGALVANGYDGTKGYALSSWLAASSFPAPSPVVTADPPLALAPATVTLDGTSSVLFGDLSLAQWEWWFEYDSANPSEPADVVGLGPTFSTQVHTYAAGTYSVRLRLTDSASQVGDNVFTDLITVVEVPQAPAANFVADREQGPAPFDLVLRDQSTGNPTSWSWTVTSPTGLIDTSTDPAPIIQLTELGFYDVSLTVQNLFGSSTATKLQYIFVADPSPPIPDFTVSPESGPHYQPFTFTNRSQNFVLAGWSLGDGTIFVGENPPPHTFADGPQVYDVQLTVINEVGTFASLTKQVLAVADDSEISPSAPAELAVAIARTYDPTVVTQTGGVVVSADFAEATATAFGPTVTVNSNAVIAADLPVGTATAFAPSVVTDAIFTADFPVATSSAPDPNVNVGQHTLARPDLALASATAFAPTVSLGVSIAIKPELAIASATAFSPTFSGGATVTADLPTAVAVAFTPAFSTGTGARILADLPLATATAFAVTTGAGVTVAVDLPVATSQTFDPTIRLDYTVAMAFAVATATAFDPTLVTDRNAVFTADFPIATADAPTPNVNTGASTLARPTIALATSQAFAPTVDQGTGATVALPLARALPLALDPVVDAQGPTTVELPLAIAPARAFSAIAYGSAGISVQVQTAIATALAFQAEAAGNIPVRVLVPLAEVSASAPQPIVRANLTDALDTSDLTGSVEGPSDLLGSV